MAATKAFAKALPPKAILDIDGTTGTVRMLAKLDGYLTRQERQEGHDGGAQVRPRQPHRPRSHLR